MPKIRISQVPHYLLYFILAALPLERVPALHPEVGSFEVTVRLTQIAGVLLIAFSMPQLWEKRHQLIRSPWKWLVLFMFLAVLSTGLAININRAVLVTLFIGFDAALAWTISNKITTKHIERYMFILIASGVAASLFGLFQFFADLRGLPTSITGLLPRYTKDVFSFPRVQSTAYEPLFFANYLLIPLSLATVNVLRGKRIYLISLMVMMTAFWLTLSRGAYFGLAGALILLLIWAIRHRVILRMLSALLVLGVGIGLATGAVAISQNIKVANGGGNAESPQEKSDSVRIFANQSTGFTGGDSFFNRSQTWKVAWNNFQDNPALGTGPGTFGIIAHDLDPSYFKNRDAVVNNEPLELLSEHGLLGTLAFLAFAFSLGAIALRRLRQGASDLTHFQIGLIAALVGIAIQYQTFSTLYITHIWVTIGLLVGALLIKQSAEA